LSKDQSYSYIPFEIGNKIRINIIGKNKINTLLIGHIKVNISPKIKIQITPFGLLSIHLSYSITSNKKITENELILIQKELSSNKNSFIEFNGKLLHNTTSLYNFIKSKVVKAILINNDLTEILDFGDPVFAVSFDYLTEETDYSDDKNFLEKKILGILNQDIKYANYNTDFVNSYRSLFGKYKDDFVYVKNNKLLYHLYSGCKKVLYNWEVSQTYNYFIIKREMNNYIKNKLVMIDAKTKLKQIDFEEIEAIEIFLNSFNHYENLSNPMRKMFNEINKSFSYNYNDKENIQLFKEIKSRMINNNLVDSFILQPNFMGFGIDLMKLRNFFTKN